MTSTKDVERFWRLYAGDFVRINLQFEFRDLWFGLFWRTTEIGLHLYICLIPTMPLHITIANAEYSKRKGRSQ